MDVRRGRFTEDRFLFFRGLRCHLVRLVVALLLLLNDPVSDDVLPQHSVQIALHYVPLSLLEKLFLCKCILYLRALLEIRYYAPIILYDLVGTVDHRCLHQLTIHSLFPLARLLVKKKGVSEPLISDVLRSGACLTIFQGAFWG